eukprot:Hpha_TRINITY_DN16191_c6_g4::TRINITY_DN16191_c6_g4_i1::g.4956::m.4956
MAEEDIDVIVPPAKLHIEFERARLFDGVRCLLVAERITSRKRKKKQLVALSLQFLAVMEEAGAQVGVKRRLVPLTAIHKVFVGTVDKTSEIPQVLLQIDPRDPHIAPQRTEPDLVFNFVQDKRNLRPPKEAATYFVQTLARIRHHVYQKDTEIRHGVNPVVDLANYRPRKERMQKKPPDKLAHWEREYGQLSPSYASRPSAASPQSPQMPEQPQPAPELPPAVAPREVPPLFSLRHRSSGMMLQRSPEGRGVAAEPPGSTLSFNPTHVQENVGGHQVGELVDVTTDEFLVVKEGLLQYSRDAGEGTWFLNQAPEMSLNWRQQGSEFNDVLMAPKKDMSGRVVMLDRERMPEDLIHWFQWDLVSAGHDDSFAQDRNLPAEEQVQEQVQERLSESSSDFCQANGDDYARQMTANSMPRQPRTPAGNPPPAENTPDPRRVRWLEQGFRGFFAKHDPLRDVDSHASAESTAGREHETYRRLLAEYPRCPVADLDWLLHPPPSVFRDPADAPRHQKTSEVVELQKEVHALSLMLLERMTGESPSRAKARSLSPHRQLLSPAEHPPVTSPPAPLAPTQPQGSPARGQGGQHMSPAPPHGDALGGLAAAGPGEEQVRLLRRLLHLQQCSMEANPNASDGERHGDEGQRGVLNEQLRLLRQLAIPNDTSSPPRAVQQPPPTQSYVGAPSFAPGAQSYPPAQAVRFISPPPAPGPPPATLERMRWVMPTSHVVSVPMQKVVDHGDITPKITPPPPATAEWMPVSMSPNAPPHYLSVGSWDPRPLTPGFSPRRPPQS